MITIVFAILVASFLLYVECKVVDFGNKNNKYQELGFICFIFVVLSSTTLFYYFTH